jgi:opacity protein-like surface antigen
MPPRLIFFLFACFSLVAVIQNAAAQEASAPEVGWNPPSAGPITTWTAPLCGKGNLVIQPFFFYNQTRGEFDEKGHYNPLSKGDVGYQFQQQLFLQYGIFDWLEVDAQSVYQENYIKQGGVEAHSNGFGDSYLFLRARIIEEKGWLPHITGLLQLKMPTGKYQHEDSEKLGSDLMGTGSWDPGFGLTVTKTFRPFIFHAGVTYSFPQRVRINGVETWYANYLNCDLAVEYFLPKGFNLMVEANSFFQGDLKEDGVRINNSRVQYLMITPAIGWSCDKLQILLGYQRIVMGTNTDANDSVALTLVYTF